MRAAYMTAAITLCCLAANAEDKQHAVSLEFDRQVQTLIASGYPNLFGGRENFDREMARLKEEALRKNDTELLIVITNDYAPIPWQFNKIKTRKEITKRIFELDVLDFANGYSAVTPKKPYLIYGVSTGEGTLGTPILDVIAYFVKNKLRALTLEEGVNSLIQHPIIPNDVGVAFIGSNHDGNGQTWYPYIAIEETYFHGKWMGSIFHGDWHGMRAWDNNTHSFRFPSCKE